VVNKKADLIKKLKTKIKVEKKDNMLGSPDKDSDSIRSLLYEEISTFSGLFCFFVIFTGFIRFYYIGQDRK